MAGFTSSPIAATVLTSNGTANGAVGIASVTGWQQGSLVSLSNNTTTPTIYAVIIGIDTVNNLLILKATGNNASQGWAQRYTAAQSAANPVSPPHLNESVGSSSNANNMTAWTTALAATISQISTFIYQNNGINGPI